MSDSNEKQTKNQKLLQVIGALPMVTDKQGKSYLRTCGEKRTDHFRIESEDAYGEVVKQCLQNFAGLPANEQTVKALLKVAGALQRQRDSARYDIRPRVAKAREHYVYDHADENGNCTRWNASGWEFLRNDAIPFIRTNASATPEPKRPRDIEEAFATIQEFQDLQRLSESMRLPRLAALIEDLKPDTPYVIRHNHGSAGSGKTTAAALEILLLDPFGGPVPPQVVPHIEHMAVAAQHRHHLFFDNIRRVDDEVSNFLCCAALGSPVMWRTMHERSGATTLSVHAPIQITGIHYHLAPDLADRSLVTEFPVRSDYRPMAEVMATFHANHGRYLGALFTLAVETLRRI